MKKLLLLFALTCIPAISGFTQTILHSEFALLYEINIPGFDIYNSKKLLKKLPAICKVPVDTIPYNDLYTYKTQFNREGNYLLAYAEGYTIKAEIISHFPWKYKLAYYPYKGGLYVYDDMNKPMTRLKVTFDWEKMEYDSLAQLYTFNNLYNGAGITISNGKQKQCFAWTRSYHDRSNYYDDSYGEAKYTGFTITNQPEYKKGDTLKTKIYICRSDNGKPYKKDIELVINRYPKPAIIVSLKPISPGAYVYQTLINDSFDLDRSYTIDIHEEGKYATLTQANFKVADYKLRETTYQLTPQAYQLYKGDSVGYLFDALDPNGNLIYDAEVDLEIRVKYINRIYDKRVFIPDTLFKGTMAMTTTEEGYFTLPSDLFFAYKADYVCEVKATCRNLQNELAHFTHVLYIYNRAKPMSVYASRGYFHFIKNGEKNSHVKVKTSFIGDKADWQEYPIDDSVKINAKATSYEFITQTDTLKQTVSSALIFADVITRTSGDSVFVKPYNPAQVPFYMYYLKDDDIHRIGAGDTLFVLKKNDVVYLYWEYWVADNKIVNTKTLYLKEKNIEITHTLPEKVFPGEKRTVNIKTRTYKGNPLAQTNLTFFAYNNTFTDDVNTYIPNFDKYYGPGGTSPSGYMYELSKASVNIPIDTAWYKKLKLDDDLYYKTSYSKNTVDYIYLPTEKSDQCLVKVFGMNAYHHVYDPGVVMENETAVYFNKSLTRHIICNEGKHNFTVHMLGKNYELKNVEAKKDSALYIMIHINHPEMVKTAVEDTHTVYWKNKVLERFAFLSIGDLSYSDLLFFDNKTGYARNGSYSNELIVGPFDTLQNVWTEYAQNGEISAIWGQITPFVKNKVRKSGYEILPLKMYEVNIGTLYENLYFSDYDAKKLLKTRNEWITEKTMPAQSYPQLETYLKFKPYYNEMVILDHKMLHGVYGTLLFSLDKNYIKQYKGFITNLTDLGTGSYKIIYVNNRLEPLAEDTFSIQKNGKYYLDLDSTSLYNYQSNYIPHYLRWLYPELIQGDITGKVIDEKGEKVPFAQVNIFYNDSLLHKTYTDINGVFYLSKNTRLTDLNIEISSLGIGYFKLNHFTIANPADTLKITLRMQPIELSEIEVNRIDRVSAYASSSTMGEVDIVSMNTVSFDRNELQSLVVTPGVAGYFNGARQSSTVFVDGVKVRSGSEAIPGRGNERVESILGGVPAKYGDSKNKTDSLLGKITNTDKYNNNNDDGGMMIMPADLNKIRSVFSDCAIWEPNMITNENGETSCTVKFPDNITAWNTYILAIHPKGYSGQIMQVTKSFKPVTAQLYVPDFVVEGDSFEIAYKTNNYTQGELPFTQQLEMGYILLFKGDTMLKNFVLGDYMLYANSKDSIKISYSGALPGGYTDGELRTIPVYKKGISISYGKMIPVWKNRTIQIDSMQKNSPTTLHIYNGFANLLENEAHYMLFTYMHGCNEQMSSKLITAIAAAEITDKPWKKDLYQGQIRKMIRLLEKNQNEQGGWSWWGKGSTNSFMTLRVCEALNFAAENGYEVKLGTPVKDALPGYLKFANDRDDSLYVLKIASIYDPGNKTLLDFKTMYMLEQVKRMDQKLMVAEIRQNYGFEYSLDEILGMRKETIYGNYYWGDEGYHLFYNKWYQTSMALNLMQKSGVGEDTLIRVLGYMLEQRIQDHFPNTLSSAQMSIFFRNYKKQHTAGPVTVIMDGKDSLVTLEPYFETIVPNPPQNLQVITNQLVYIGYSQEKELEPAAVKTDLFEIKNEWIQKTKHTDTLQSGDYATLHTQVVVKKQAEYVSLEIPIPAGCTYAEKPQSVYRYYMQSTEVHREYFKDRIVIYFSKIQPGTYDYYFSMEPRFKGSYSMNNAKMESMYFPQINGYNALVRVKIK